MKSNCNSSNYKLHGFCLGRLHWGFDASDHFLQPSLLFQGFFPANLPSCQFLCSIQPHGLIDTHVFFQMAAAFPITSLAVRQAQSETENISCSFRYLEISHRDALLVSPSMAFSIGITSLALTY